LNRQLLSRTQSPQDVKALSMKELERLCREIRNEIVNVVSHTGGHLAGPLGAVEIAVALHRVFESPRDKLVWDVGHTAYAHKLLTGRREGFQKLRTRGGVAGYLKRAESEHDAFGAGHASTSISAALGYAKARDHRGEDHKVVAIIGDGGLTGGMAFEGINNAAMARTDLLVVLNDNEMSISPNVGAVSKVLTKITTGKVYKRFEAEVWEFLGRIPNLGSMAQEFAHRLRESVKGLIAPGMFFEELGFRYFGPLDGHDLPLLVETLEKVRDLKGPNIVHVLTRKGKGYGFAEQDSNKYHGVGAFDKTSGRGKKKKGAAPSYSKVFGDCMITLAERTPELIAITAAMADGTGLAPFAKSCPDRFYDVGIAEQHAVTFAAGLAAGGMTPVCAIYSTFLQRGFDQLVHDVGIQNLPVVFALDRAGLVGEDGPTHHGVFDLSYLRAIPNFVVMAPKDENEFRHMLYTAVRHRGSPSAVRYPRGSGQGVALEAELRELPLGKGEVLRAGKDLAFVAVGSEVHPCLEAAALLAEQGIEAEVVNARFVKPLDRDLIGRVLSEQTLVLTVEENTVRGGFGAGVLELATEIEGRTADVHVVGVPDRFQSHASRAQLLESVGLDAASLARRAGGLLGEKRESMSRGRSVASL
jgi:1-deoxy-D-xylulose-5-phosphate synthase